MAARRILFIGGGTRSGKSDFALAQARRLGRRRLFLATAQAGDAEMGERIRLHRQSRGADFETTEEPLDVPEALCRATGFDVILLDCLTLWLANLLLEGHAPEVVLRRAWLAVRFSWWFTSITHKFSDDPFAHRLQLAELDYLSASVAALTSLAENYVGLPFATPA